MFIQNDYYKKYYKIIKDSDPLPTDFTENHHIIPKSMGGANDKLNMVQLTLEDHFKVHTLLPYFTDGVDREKMVYAWNQMSNRNGHPINYLEYSFLREEHSRIHSERMTGRTPSDETKKKISISNTGKTHSDETKKKISENRDYKTGEDHHLFGTHHSEKTKRKISENHSDVNGENNPFYGKKHSDESIRKMSESKKGTVASKETREKMSEARKGRVASKETIDKTKETWKTKEKIICPHCGKVGISRGPMNYWHFDNCKYKK